MATSDIDRRNFIKTAGIVGAVGLGLGATAKVIADSKLPETLGALTEHTLPSLPYAYNALEPFSDEETMTTHHSKHHQGYVDGLNKSEKALAESRATGDFSLIEYWSKKSSFNGGGNALHSIFWTVMAPAKTGPLKGKGGGEPSGELSKKLSRDFGSLEVFKKQFSAAAANVEGSGWAALSHRKSDDRLIVHQIENQHKLSSWDATPILVLDVWEHAYYLKYKNMRKDYVEAWWNVVNWDAVGERLG